MTERWIAIGTDFTIGQSDSRTVEPDIGLVSVDLSLPSIRRQEQLRPLHDGAFTPDQYLQGRVITAEVLVNSDDEDTFEERLAALRQAFNTSSVDLAIQLPGWDSPRTAVAATALHRSETIDVIHQVAHAKRVLCQWYCGSSTLTGATHDSASATLTTAANTGWTYERVSAWSYGDDTSNGAALTLTIPRSIVDRSPGALTFDVLAGTLSVVNITHVEQSKTLRIVVDPAVTLTGLTIDLKSRDVYGFDASGNATLFNNWVDDYLSWFLFTPRQNNILVTVSGSSDLVVDFEATAGNEWL